MMMCLCNYLMGNTPVKYYDACLFVKEKVFSHVWGWRMIDELMYQLLAVKENYKIVKSFQFGIFCFP